MKKRLLKSSTILICIVCAAVLLGIAFVFLGGTAAHAAEVRPIVFPVIGDVRYTDDFGAPRSGGRTHEGNDILGSKSLPLVAAVDGTIRFVAYPEPDYGYMISIEDADGYQYWYLHVNNDNPGTDDGNGGGMNAYAPDVMRGYPVVAGQLIGWMGDSGNAEGTTPHLHFEIHRPDGTPIDPFNSLYSAKKISRQVIAPALPFELLPYGQFTGGASIAYGNVDAGAVGEELITAAGPGGGPQVRVFTQDGHLLSQFFAYDQGFRGGLDVATGDIDGDGIDEIIVGPGNGLVPEIRVYRSTGQLLNQIMAYAPTFRGGVRVAAADLDGDGVDEIVTGAGNGGGPHVRIMNGQGVLISQFFAYAETFRGGIDVAAYSATDESPAVIVTGAGNGGGPHVRVWNRYGDRLAQFFAYDEQFRGGVHVDVGNVLDDTAAPEIVTAPAARGGADVRIFSLAGLRLRRDDAFEPWWRGGYDVAAAEGVVSIASGYGGRRSSVRNVFNHAHWWTYL